MGTQGSKESAASLYEETKRLFTPDQLIRLREAWHVRCVDANSINFTTFYKEVFDDNIPYDAANALFDLFSQNEENITFEQLVTGLALLCVASEDRRKSFFQSNESCARVLPKEWIQQPPGLDAMELAKVTSFYEILAGVTHLDTSEVAELEKIWPEIYDVTSCKLPRKKFANLVSPPVPSYIVDKLFEAFDENSDDMIDFKELVCGLSASCRGPHTERYKFVFKMFADHNSSTVSFDELSAFAVDEQLSAQSENMTLGTFLTWATESGSIRDLLNLISEIGHICLGLPPEDHCHKKQLILSYQRRVQLCDADQWYLVSRKWWKQFSESNGSGDNAKAPPVDNSDLISADNSQLWTKLPSITSEGGRLRADLSPLHAEHLVPVTNALWNALARWYGCKGPTLPRYIIEQPATGDFEPPDDLETMDGACARVLELYPPTLVILRHSNNSGTLPQISLSGGGIQEAASTTVGWLKDTLVGSVSGNGPNYRRVPYATATFSCVTTVKTFTEYLLRRLHLNSETARIWLILPPNNNGNPSKKPPPSPSSSCSGNECDLLLLDEPDLTLQELGVTVDGRLIVVESRAQDCTWPEEVMQLRVDRESGRGKKVGSRLEWRLQSSQRGIVGLSNLGNTCFMNSALQCLSHTRKLTEYFLNERHFDQLDKTKLAASAKGQIALEYASLLKELWDGNSKVVAPVKLRSAINRHFPRFRNSSQHDAQEFLSLLLDTLHEDLNRLGHKSESGRKGSMAGSECQQVMTTLKDSDGRPDALVAQECWAAYTSRHSSIVTDVFLGQLKSEVRCVACGRTSARFDPFTCLSLPLPLEEMVLLFVALVRLDGSTPVRYGLRVAAERRVPDLISDISRLCDLAPKNMLLLELNRNGRVLREPAVYEQAKTLCLDGALLYAYELPRGADSLPPRQSSRLRLHEKTGAVAGDGVFAQRLPRDGAELAEKVQLQLAVSCSASSGVGCGTHSSPSASPATTADLGTGTGTGTNSDSGIQPCSGPHQDTHSHSRGDSDSTDSVGSGTDSGAGGTARVEGVCVQLAPCPDSPRTTSPLPTLGYALAVHRQIEYNSTHFLAYTHSRPVVFGCPLVVPLLPPGGWSQEAGDHWEDSYRYPYTIRLVDRTFSRCGKCAWHTLCRGCAVPLNASPLPELNGCCLAIDWDAAALHLRYRHSSELHCVDDQSVQLCSAEHSRPTSLQHCLQQFTMPEHLADGESVFCKHCDKNNEATMKVDIWRPPPVLIVHLKRFVFVSGGWVKSSKRVHFELVDTGTIGGHVLCKDYDKCAYACTAVVCHYGNIAKGHYVTFVRPSIGDSDTAVLGDQWYVCNDSRVAPLPASMVDTANAYMMFFERLPCVPDSARM